MRIFIGWGRRMAGGAQMVCSSRRFEQYFTGWLTGDGVVEPDPACRCYKLADDLLGHWLSKVFHPPTYLSYLKVR